MPRRLLVVVTTDVDKATLREHVRRLAGDDAQVGLAELRESDGSGDFLAEPSAADWEAEAYPGSAFAALNVYSAA